jgi:hypothetical protein
VFPVMGLHFAFYEEFFDVGFHHAKVVLLNNRPCYNRLKTCSYQLELTVDGMCFRRKAEK